MQVTHVDNTVRIRIRGEDGRKGALVVVDSRQYTKTWNLDTGEFMTEIPPEYRDAITQLCTSLESTAPCASESESKTDAKDSSS